MNRVIHCANETKVLRLLKAGVLGVALLASLVSCRGKPEPSDNLGSARVVLRAQSPLEVAQVTLVIQGGNLPSPRTETLAVHSSHVEFLVGGLPAGTGYSFTATGADAQGVVLYRGSAMADILANQTVAVFITLLQVAPPPPFKNAAPIIDSVVIAPALVAPGDVVSVSASAHDPNPEDTLTFTWTASAGGFANPSAAVTTWTAPSAEGEYNLAIEVRDNHGARVAVAGKVRVALTSQNGNADVTLSFDSSPMVVGFTSDPGWFEAGVPTSLTVQAQDPDDDMLSYAWTTTCAGTFAGTGATNSFTLGAGETASSCTVTVTVTDGSGLSGTGELTLPTGKPVVREPPVITSSLQSLVAVEAGQMVTFKVEATDPNGSALTFAWSASAGTLSEATNTTNSSTVVWTAPNAPASDWQITASISNASGLSVSKVFVVKPAQLVDGGVDGGGPDGAGGQGGSSSSSSGTGTGGTGGGTGGTSTGGTGGGGGTGGQAFTVNVSVAPGATTGTAVVDVSLVGTTESISSVAVSVAPDGVTATVSAARVMVSGLTAKTNHTFTVTVTTSSGSSVVTTTNALAFYDVLEIFHEPMVDDSNFTGRYTFDTVAGTVSNLSGVLFDGMNLTTVALSYQLSAQSVSLGGMSGQLVATFALPTTATFTGGGWAPGGTKTYENFNAYALVFVPATDPTQALAAAQINWLAYADCTADGLMGKTCMTGTTVEAYGRTGTMSAYPVSQATTLR